MAGQDTNSASIEPEPSFRATLSDGLLFVIDWRPVMVGLGRAEAVVSDGSIADLMVTGADDDELIVTYGSLEKPLQEMHEKLLSWAGHVGYRRVWLPDAVVDTRFEAFGSAEATCRACGMEYVAEGPDFWLRVRRMRIFPSLCSVCGCDLPQWEVTNPDSDGLVEASGALGESP